MPALSEFASASFSARIPASVLTRLAVVPITAGDKAARFALLPCFQPTLPSIIAKHLPIEVDGLPQQQKFCTRFWQKLKARWDCAGVILGSEWLALEIAVMMGGLLPAAALQLSAMAIYNSTNDLCFMISNGMAVAIASR